MSDLNTQIIVLPSASLRSQIWAAELHTTINKAFKNKDVSMYPPTWERLHPDPLKGIQGLVRELGPLGFIVVALRDQRPVACGGFLPARNLDWINHVKSVDADAEVEVLKDELPATEVSSRVVELWEICCFCILPDFRKQGLAQKLIAIIEAEILPRGAKKLMTNCAVEESGAYWQRMGFKAIPSATSVLKAGFMHSVSMEPLNADIHYQMGAKDLR
jgi:GNAT superfamily N-acetyltransferase